MLEKKDLVLKNGEVCCSQFDAVLLGKTEAQGNDEGIVTVTQKRLVFNGEKSLAFSIARIVAYDCNPGKISFHMENGNVIVFDTKQTYAPSVAAHVASIAGGNDAAAVPPLQTIEAWQAEQATQKEQQGIPQQVGGGQRMRPAKRRRQNRKKKITEDIMTAILILIVIAALYLWLSPARL